MKFIEENKITIFIVLAIIAAGLVVYYFINANIISQKVTIISNAINSGAGLLGTDVDSILLNTEIDSTYQVSESDLTDMNATDSSTIISALSGKAKADIKQMVASYLNTYGETFNAHLNDAFTSWYGSFDSAAYSSVLAVIQSAP